MCEIFEIREIAALVEEKRLKTECLKPALPTARYTDCELLVLLVEYCSLHFFVIGSINPAISVSELL